MEHIIHAEQRTDLSKSALKKLRINGEIPAIVYGNHKEPVAIHLNQKNFRKEFSHISESTLITLNINGGETKTVLIKDYNHDLVRGAIQHIDFYEIEKGKSLTTHVSINTEGAAIGARQGGILEHLLHEIEIECLPKDLPEVLTLDISDLQIGESLHVSDLPKLSRVEYKSPAEQVVVHISAPKKISLEPQLDEDTPSDEEEAE